MFAACMRLRRLRVSLRHGLALSVVRAGNGVEYGSRTHDAGITIQSVNRFANSTVAHRPIMLFLNFLSRLRQSCVPKFLAIVLATC